MLDEPTPSKVILRLSPTRRQLTLTRFPCRESPCAPTGADARQKGQTPRSAPTEGGRETRPIPVPKGRAQDHSVLKPLLPLASGRACPERREGTLGACRSAACCT